MVSKISFYSEKCYILICGHFKNVPHVPNPQVSLWQCWLNTAKLSLGLLLIFKRSFVESCLTLTLWLMCYSLEQVDWFESTVLLLLFCLLE